jgi:ubiquitin-activating enzyme E1
MTELNDREFIVTVIDTKQFAIGDTSAFHPYTCEHGNGYGIKVIVPTLLHFTSLSDSLKNPSFADFDFNAFGRDRQVLLAFWTQARLIETGRPLTAENLAAVAAEVNGEFHWVDEIESSLIAEFAREEAVIAPTAAVFGGIAAQEVMKSLSLKFLPFQGFLAVGYVEALPPAPIVFEPKGDRYDPYRLIFGNAQIDVIFNLRYFLVGAGAIGCEILKNWALMGDRSIGCQILN